MASAQSSRDTWRGRDRQIPTSGNPRPRHRSESRRLSDRRPVRTVARKRDHCPGGALHVGDAVRVFSRSADDWVDGEVVNLVEDNYVRVEYEVGEYWCGKTLHLYSKHLDMQIMGGVNLKSFISPAGSPAASGIEHDPGGNFITGVEAASALQQHVFIQLRGEGFKPVADVFELTFVRNNSFAIKVLLTLDCVIEYQGCCDEDVLLKVYTLEKQYPPDQYDRYTLQGYIHAMQMPRVPLLVEAGCFVGFVIHKDLNKDWLWKMKEEDPARYQNFITRSDPGGYQYRGDPIGERYAADADYLISFSTSNKEQNDEILRDLCSKPVQGPHGSSPITFCTDRSLGFGGHFDASQGFGHLYLAKHGFGQPTKQGAWFDEYKRAFSEVKHGLLILNPSDEYFKSAACLKEFEMSGRPTSFFVYSVHGHRISQWNLGGSLLDPHWDAPPVINAAREGDVAMLKVILQEDGNAVCATDHGGHTPLTWALYRHRFEAAACLISYRADINAEGGMEVCGSGMTPLHEAVNRNDVKGVTWLLKNRADVQSQTDAKSTALHIAAKLGSPEVVEHLLCARAIVNSCDDEECTPLIWATRRPNYWDFDVEEIVTKLLTQRASVNHRDNDRQTPLLAAIGSHCEVRVVERLLEARADINRRDYDGRRVLDLAGDYLDEDHRTEIIQLLHRYKRRRENNRRKVSDEHYWCLWDMLEEEDAWQKGTPSETSSDDDDDDDDDDE